MTHTSWPSVARSIRLAAEPCQYSRSPCRQTAVGVGERLAILDPGDVPDDRRVEDRVDGRAVVVAALGQALTRVRSDGGRATTPSPAAASGSSGYSGCPGSGVRLTGGTGSRA